MRRGPLPIDQVLRYAIEIADALDHAHRAGIVHRDLKPANVMLTRTGAKLLDFGLARLLAPETSSSEARPTQAETLTEEGTIVGTVQYMAPEQLEARDTDGRTDIFAFGAVVFEMATARQAFEGTSGAGVMAAILERDPPSLSAARSQRESGPSHAEEPVLPVATSIDRHLGRCYGASKPTRESVNPS